MTIHPALAALLLGVLLPAHANPEPVTFDSLLGEMTDRDRLASLPDPAYTCRQFSSYDRAATSPDDQSTWFANADFSKFLRTEEYDGKTQHVMMDTAGPGAIVRFWVTWVHRPEGMLRIFLDGSDNPEVEAPLHRFIDGGELAGPPLSAGVSPETEYDRRGHNLYLPIPYARHCKITYEGPIKGSLYYQINYRTYSGGTKVTSFRRSDPERSKDFLDRVQRRLLSPPITPANSTTATLLGTIDPGASRAIDRTGPAAIRELALRLQAKDMEQALRSTVLAIEFDGTRTVWCPLGDFFGTGHQLHPSKTWYTAVGNDGSMSCSWLMPFKKSARVAVHNHGKQPITLALGNITTTPWKWTDRSMHFHGTWHELRHKPVVGGRGTEDANYVTITGRGVYVGDTLTVFNAAHSWWGEGDEKIHVDGEKFPSHFGTGTEDYYGYAWCRPESFTAPFQAQPSGAGNLRSGMSVNSRFRSLDAIPFESSLKFDMELWHWATTKINYAPTTFWYALPGAACNVAPDPDAAAQAVARIADDIVPVPRIKGAIEGEAMKEIQKTGGSTEMQGSTTWNWSGFQQVWWMDGKPGDKLLLGFEVPTSGRHRVIAHLTQAPDYGIHQIRINGKPAGTHDFYETKVIWKPIDLGVHDLRAGANQLEITVTGSNDKAIKRHMFGLDCLLLKQP
jgi:hypothetical protein